MKANLDTGVHDLTETEYDGLDALRNSTLNHFSKGTDAHAKYLIDHPPGSKDHLDIGSALDCAITRPGDFDAEWVVGPQVDRRSNKNTALWAEFEAENVGRGILKQTDMSLVLAMRDGISRHPLARTLFHGEGRSQVTLLWEEHDLSQVIRCKARIDRLTEYEDFVTLVDLKTTRGMASSWAFGRAIGTFGYHRQQAFYMRGFRALFGDAARRFLFVAVEKDPPHLVGVHELSDEDAHAGDRQVAELIEKYARCQRLKVWNAWPNEPMVPSSPPWFLRADYEEEIF